MKPSPQLSALLGRMPEPDERGTFADIDKEKVEAAVVEIHRGGRDHVLGLIDMLVEPGQGDDVKPHYALHCLAVHVGKLDDDRPRAEFAGALASQIGGRRPKAVEKYLIRQLQVAGGPEVVGTLGKALLDEELCEPAAQALVAIGGGAAGELRRALPNVGKACRLTILQNLGVLADAASVAALKEAASDDDRDCRLAAVSGLAGIGDPGSVDLLLKAADADGWEGIRATDACLVLAEKLLAAGKTSEAAKIGSHLRRTRTDPAERHVREAAERILAGTR